MMHHLRVAEAVSAFASHVHDLHKEISKKIQENNAHYKYLADLHRRHFEFNNTDYEKIQFPPETIKKLHVRSTGPFKIFKKINSNVYVIDLLSNLGGN